MTRSSSYFSIYLIAGALILLQACNADPSPVGKNQGIVVTGTISGAEIPNTVRIDRFDTEIDSDSIRPDGTFVLELEAKTKGLYVFMAARNAVQLFLAPDDSLHIALDLESETNMWNFSGSSSAEANLLREIEEVAGNSGMKDFPGPWALSYAEYAAKRDSVAAGVHQVIELGLDQQQMDTDFASAVAKLKEMYHLQFDVMYPVYHGYFSEGDLSMEGFDKNALLEQIAAISIEDPLALEFGAVKNVLEYRLQTHTEEAMTRLEEDTAFMITEEVYYDLAFKAPSTVFGKESLMSDFFTFEQYRQILTYQGPKSAEAYSDTLEAMNLPETYMEVIARIESRWEPVMPGKEVPDFAFIDRDSTAVRLSDLRGNLVYMDLWATWCGPCIQEHPYWEQLKDDYEDAPIAFVAISIDDNPSPWVKMLNEKGMEGKHWYAQGAWSSSIAKHFMVNSIPRFLLLDATGKVIDPSAARPSGKIREVLDAELARMS